MHDNSLIKKAVVVGGSNGIGSAVAQKLISNGYNVFIVDKTAPHLVSNKIKYIQCDLSEFDENVFESLAIDTSVNFLMISAGVGRVADFDYLHLSEISKILEIDTVSAIKIIKIFYDRINSKNNFYCGIMGSIAGLISSPAFSVYAAAKAAICRFIESINIELEIKKSANRILNISPGSIKGTSFNGENTDLSLLNDLADNIYSHIMQKETLYIPQYNVYKKVIYEYQSDPHLFGISSYNYKLNSGRLKNERKVCIGYLSGTFDLFHIGHLNLLKRAKQQCDYLIVGVHPDAKHKNKEVFMSLDDRKSILNSCKYVDKVVDSCKEDSDAWKLYYYDKLFVGSDYEGSERFLRYEKYFEEKNVSIIYLPYTQGISSTQIRNALQDKVKCEYSENSSCIK